jgi:hypothetical protein
VALTGPRRLTVATTRHADRPASNRGDFTKAVQELRRWHRLGTGSPKPPSGTRSTRGGTVAEDASRLRVSVAKLRKLRQFADPKSGYDRKRL